MSAVTLAEVKAHLNITVTTQDVELQATIDAAEAAISRLVGPLVATTTTSRVRGCRSALLLPTTPLISLTSVTPIDGAALTLSDLYGSPSGVVTYSAGTGSFPSPWYTVVYSAGRATLPADLGQAVKELVRHFWATQRGGSTRPGSTPPDGLSNTLVGAAYSLPIRVEQLLVPHMTPGFA